MAVALRNLAWQKTEGQGPFFALALLSYSIDFNVMNDALAEDMVNRCLRHVVYINEARDLMRTTQPSEPILAFVASERMRDPETRLRVIRQFARSCFEGTVNVGDVGEITAYLLFLLAYDEAVQNQQTIPAPIPLVHFMASMFGPQPGENMGTCMVMDQDMKKVWETGQVFFNHFVKVSKVPDAAKLEETFERGAALFLPDRFPELYPFIDQYTGVCTEETAQILPTLHRLLDCVPGTSLPDDIEEDFVRRLMPLG